MSDRRPTIHCLVCEAGDRWHRTFNAWRPVWQRVSGCRLVIRPAGPDELRAWAMQHSHAVYCWEIPTDPQRAAARAQIVRGLATLPQRPLQICALTAESADEPSAADRIALTARQLGADWVIRAPEEMPRGWRLVARYLRGAPTEPESDAASVGS